MIITIIIVIDNTNNNNGIIIKLIKILLHFHQMDCITYK